MHHFYKNRLVRCYLGASNPNRHPDSFTNLDSRDDFPLKKFADGSYCGPYPILNAAVNLAGANALAWQERKSASFVFTPNYCGYDKPQLDREAGNTPSQPLVSRHAYAQTDKFGGDDGIKIGTAMAISGAAANPNAGYHTSTAVAFLLTLFNVRLGWWLGNPARFGKANNPSPVFGLPYLGVELFGLANTDKAFINVSDGGHFENLGIYELVRRRCRYIIASDAEQDGGMKFEGLANAIRKCRTDLDVNIEIDLDQLRRKNGFSSGHCVVGKFTYPEAPDIHGYLLYLKSSLTGNEDTDVLQYHSNHPGFPHESTGDQWFDESQFESYRKLGLHIVNAAFSRVADALKPSYGTLETYADAKTALFEDLWSVLYPASEAIQKSFTRHADAYTKLVEAVGKGPKSLDRVIFSEWKPVSVNGDSDPRQTRYLCTSFLQLMENVFVDLNLADERERNHPHNAGWIQLFQDWAATAAFRDAWDVAGPTYGKPFQKFYESLVREVVAKWEGIWTPRDPDRKVIRNLQKLQLTSPNADSLTGKVTEGNSDRVIETSAYDGKELTFSLKENGSGYTTYRLQLIDDGETARLINAAGEEAFMILEKTEYGRN